MSDNSHKTFVSEELEKTFMRVHDQKGENNFRLNRNEFAFDIAEENKLEILKELANKNWNHYPDVIDENLHVSLAKYLDVNPDMICTGAGAAALATCLLNYFALQGKSFIIPRPTFSLYEYHCKAYKIPYKIWESKADFTYDLEKLPEVNANDIILVVSPNNPTGTVFASTELESLLKKYPDNLFITDEVYYEFSEDSYTHLLEYENLIIIRSISKSLAAAALRFGYLLTNKELASQLRKILLPFSENLLASFTVKKLLSSSLWQETNHEQISYIKRTRSLLFQRLKKKDGLEVFPSQGNFLLVRCLTEDLHKNLLSHLCDEGIKILDCSGQAGLEKCFRISIGTEEEMEKLIDIINKQ